LPSDSVLFLIVDEALAIYEGLIVRSAAVRE
jgi:hypothetical protein